MGDFIPLSSLTKTEVKLIETKTKWYDSNISKVVL